MEELRMRERGVLDGMTILRYAHAFESGGGVEQHLADLNRALGSRSRLTTIQVQLTRDADRLGETEERVGNSVLMKVPLLVPSEEPRSQKAEAESSFGATAKRVGLDALLFSRWINRFGMRCLLGWRRVPRRPGEPEGARAKVQELLERFGVQLVVLHTSGGADASEVIEVARRMGIPLLLVHHFSNDRLGGVSLRQQSNLVECVAGASSIGVPAYLRGSFRNLSDAVDTDFFRRECAETRCAPGALPVLYAPGRLVPEKGQADVLEVASILKHCGIRVRVVFAGRADMPAFIERLAQLAREKGLSDSVQFLGPLSMAEYRNWFTAAQVTLMPTRHHEGMPRTVIDSQAMGVPPVVYEAGGMREGIIDGETGLLIKAGDVQGMASAVEKLVRDVELRKRMAVAGRKFVEERFSLTAFAQRHEDLYLEVIRHHGSRAVATQ